MPNMFWSLYILHCLIVSGFMFVIVCTYNIDKPISWRVTASILASEICWYFIFWGLIYMFGLERVDIFFKI